MMGGSGGLVAGRLVVIIAGDMLLRLLVMFVVVLYQ
jgi:hypothetical protein